MPRFFKNILKIFNIDIVLLSIWSMDPKPAVNASSIFRGRKTIRILRAFDPTLFMHHPSEDLRADMARLERIDQRTKEDFENQKK
jgi:hypothetical protein